MSNPVAAEVLTNQLVVSSNNGGSVGPGVSNLAVSYVSGAQGAIPSVVAGMFMRFFWDGEIVVCTANSGTGNVNFVLTRGAEGTTPITHADGSKLYQIVTQAGLQQTIRDFTTVQSDGSGSGIPIVYPAASSHV